MFKELPVKFCAGATFITGFNGCGHSNSALVFIACSSGMAAQINILLIVFKPHYRFQGERIPAIAGIFNPLVWR